jgi:hypothetical protein
MKSLELDWATSQIDDADSTDVTEDDEIRMDADSTDVTEDDEIRMGADSTDVTEDDEIRMEADSTDVTEDDEIRMNADSTESTQDKFGASIEAGQAASKIPSSEIVVRTIAVERSAPLAALPADANAAFSQWLSGSGLAPAKH